ncbi:hypothetical protein HYQ46_000192 [Verticillium longisporum]|nr:hypothetical protein HYQ46_000192 [Verticillium longisporum]
MVRRLLTQSKNFDFDALDALSGRIMRFRELRGISLMVYISPLDQGSYLLLRSFQNGAPWYALRGAHELCISREGGALQLRRWSATAQCARAWATLVFKTWEEMILFHCTFMSLKARNALTIQISPKEYKLSSERRLFQAQIIDDGFKHSLIVYEDVETKGIRLHAAVWEGELCRCPVWTAFGMQDPYLSLFAPTNTKA